MQTRRQLALLNALSGEQEAILNALRNLPVHAGALSAQYQKAAEVENGLKRTRHDEELAALRAEFAGNMERFAANLRQEMTRTITAKFDSLANDINSLRHAHDEVQHSIVEIEDDLLVLKKPKKPFPWGELLAMLVVFVAARFMYFYKIPQRLMIGA